MGRYINTGLTLNSTGAKKIFFNANTGSAQAWTVPAGVTCASFELWGGGGSGSPSCCCTCYGGCAGSGGAYALKTISVVPGSTYSITVGQGGCGNMCYYNGNACGCCGFTTYITGANLTNLCAEGGYGGVWCNAVTTPVQALAYGGDLNIKGTVASKTNRCIWQGQPGGIQAGGASPFGGGYQWHPYNVGSASNPLSCGLTGVFPGGGSPARHQWNDGWCDCCTGCTGGGADGLVVITI